jgi:hypothetical protein
MTLIAEGTVRGRQVELDRDTGLVNGARVRLVIETATVAPPDKRKRMAALFGSCADDPTFATALDEIERGWK